MRSFIVEGPTSEIGSLRGADSSNPLWPGKNAGLNPAKVETTRDARAPALPIPGSDEIALR